MRKKGVAPRAFVEDLELWLADVSEHPESEAEIREHFRAELASERRDEAIAWVKMKAAEIRASNAMAHGITDRVKANIAREAAPGNGVNQPQGEVK